MDAVIQSFLAGFPVLILHFGLTVVLLAAGVAIYVMITPIHEITLIRQNNIAAAVSLAGAVIGMAVPLASAMASSVNALDILIFGVVAMVLQLVAYKAGDLVLRDLTQRIEKGELASAILLVGIKLGISAITAAAVNV
jgi:putative membrane protein